MQNFNSYVFKMVDLTEVFCAVWKFHDFSDTHILREINFGGSKFSKTALFAISGALNFLFE